MIFRTAAARQLQGNFASRMRRVVAGRFATFAFRGAQVTAVGFATGCTLTAATVFCEAHQSSKSKQVQPFDVDAIREDIEKLIAADLTNGPLLVRLAWHEAASWHKTKKDGAPNTASMRFAPECKYGGNAGLDKARNLLEPIKKRHPSISYADLWVLAANVAISSMGGPEIPFRYGRVDAKDGSVCAEARLPDAAQTQQHVRDTFLGRLGFTDRETVALIGAHTIGECHADRSGFVGPWTHDRFGFDSSFFSELLENDWILDTRYPQLQFTDSKTRRLMMLPSDVALLLDKEYLKFVKLYAEDQDVWWADFAKAFQKLLELGNHNLKELPSRK